ncbi:MAG: hypothetical protein V1835_06105 [Candidatus Micrarchaeota archaeon]
MEKIPEQVKKEVKRLTSYLAGDLEHSVLYRISHSPAYNPKSKRWRMHVSWGNPLAAAEMEQKLYAGIDVIARQHGVAGPTLIRLEEYAATSLVRALVRKPAAIELYEDELMRSIRVVYPFHGHYVIELPKNTAKGPDNYFTARGQERSEPLGIKKQKRLSLAITSMLPLVRNLLKGGGHGKAHELLNIVEAQIAQWPKYTTLRS